MPYERDVVLACAADDAFARPLAVTLYSALTNYRGGAPVSIYIVDGGIKALNRTRLDRILSKLKAHVEWIRPDYRSVEKLNTSERYPASVYSRLMLPWLLPQSLEKVIYLDSDLVVEGDISELWNAEIKGLSLLAVQDEGARTIGSPWGVANYEELGLNPEAMYFNSGVLVLNLPLWRQQGFSQRIIDHIEANPTSMRFGEQDAMNAVLVNDWSSLEPKWNQLVSPWEGHDGRRYETGVLHFVSRFKPWTPLGAHWSNFMYDRYLKESGWYGTLEWWTYYVPLLVRRQQVLYLRARQRSRPAALAQVS
jgi:lipopolysaccharide biosynthesis glycosyltransferase